MKNQSIEFTKIRLLSILIAFFLLLGGVAAQSLKPDNPYPLKAGINQGTSDSLIGIHYWYFYATPGSHRLTVRFKQPITLYGTELRNNVLTINISDEKRTWRLTKTITSKPNASEATFESNKLTGKIKLIVSVAPPSQNLLRMGGDYEIEATGNAQFDDVKSATDPIVRTYQSMVNDYGATKFLADGTIQTSSGYSGTWKVFDAENHIYTVQINGFRSSVQYLPGYGLVKPGDPNGLVMFQELRR